MRITSYGGTRGSAAAIFSASSRAGRRRDEEIELREEGVPDDTTVLEPLTKNGLKFSTN